MVAEASIVCPNCKTPIVSKTERCPSCGTVMQLRRGKHLEPGQTLRDLNKFIWIGAVFLLLLIPLGMCIKPG